MITNLTDIDGIDSDAISAGAMYLDPRVAASVDDYAEDPVGDNFSNGRSIKVSA